MTEWGARYSQVQGEFLAIPRDLHMMDRDTVIILLRLTLAFVWPLGLPATKPAGLELPEGQKWPMEATDLRSGNTAKQMLEALGRIAIASKTGEEREHDILLRMPVIEDSEDEETRRDGLAISRRGQARSARGRRARGATPEL